MTELLRVQLYCKTCRETTSEQMDVSSLNEREMMRFAEVRFAIYRLHRVIVYRKVVTLDLLDIFCFLQFFLSSELKIVPLSCIAEGTVSGLNSPKRMCWFVVYRDEVTILSQEINFPLVR